MPRLQPKEKSFQNALSLHEKLAGDGIYLQAEDLTWRLSPEPFRLTREEFAFLRDLGGHLLAFHHALNQLYFESIKNRQPAWVSRYLDLGKSENVLMYGRMNRFRKEIPAVIRPDLIPTDGGFIATELDSVPGGIGITADLSSRYAELGFPVAGGASGMVDGFARMIREAGGGPSVSLLAIVVSEESRSYRPEMRWLARRLNESGLPAVMVEPGEVRFTEEGLWVETERGETRVDVLYRFFELFDLKNIPKSDLLLYALRKGLVRMTPPPKAHLEEKMALALFHHPALEPYWRSELAGDTFEILMRLFPPTWILDPRPLPPHAVIPGLRIGGYTVSDWRELAGASQTEREFILKPSGFSELAWGSRGVVAGHDLPQREWSDAVEAALSAFPHRPSVLQPFFTGRKFEMSYYDPESQEVRPLAGRARLSPYYYVVDDKAELGGILATVVPLDKKLIHGMTEGIMTPCMVDSNT